MSTAKFPSPSTIGLFGASQAGKTTFLINLIQNMESMFETPPKKIMIAYKIWQPLYEKIKDLDNVEMIEGLPEPDAVDKMCSSGDHSLLVLDDLVMELSASKICESYFILKSHHNNCSVIWVSQNIFYNGKASRTISLNTHFIVLFKNLRDKSQYATFARQAFPGKVKPFMEIYQDCIKNRFGYLLIDLHPHSDDTLRLRTNILPGETTLVYCIKE